MSTYVRYRLMLTGPEWASLQTHDGYAWAALLVHGTDRIERSSGGACLPVLTYGHPMALETTARSLDRVELLLNPRHANLFVYLARDLGNHHGTLMASCIEKLETLYLNITKAQQADGVETSPG